MIRFSARGRLFTFGSSRRRGGGGGRGRRERVGEEALIREGGSVLERKRLLGRGGEHIGEEALIREGACWRGSAY